MVLISPNPRRRGRIFPEYTIPPEELVRWKAERNARCQRSKEFFEQICPKLIDDYYNWFIIMEPNTGDYFIAPDEEIAVQKAKNILAVGWLLSGLMKQELVAGYDFRQVW